MFGWFSDAESVGLALEPRQAIGIGRELVRQHLDRDVAVQLRVAGAVDLAHAAGAEGGGDLEGAECGADVQGQ